MATDAFASKDLPAEVDVIAPDGSEIRELLALGGGSMAHCTLPAGAVSVAVAHRTVEEIWYILEGRGEVWRSQRGRQETVIVGSGTCLSIPLGTAFRSAPSVPARSCSRSSRCRPGQATTRPCQRQVAGRGGLGPSGTRSQRTAPGC